MIGLQVKGYQLIELIGRGAGSEVYRARQLASGDIVAVKVVRRDGSAGNARAFRQIVNEYEVACSWDHPNLVKFHELVKGPGVIRKRHVALAMEYVHGSPLRSGKHVTASKIVDYYVQLADAMGYMHGQGYVHLDMKPQNAMVTPDDQIKIMDFGLCMPRGLYNERVQGTPDFMAPEQLNKGLVDERTDVYNLGATMFNVITGRSVQMTLTSLSAGNGKSTVTSDTWNALIVEVPEALEGLILESCRPTPDERPGNMKVVLERLHAIQQPTAQQD